MQCVQSAINQKMKYQNSNKIDANLKQLLEFVTNKKVLSTLYDTMFKFKKVQDLSKVPGLNEDLKS